jgi:enamine deaminase RidA (YjgF/YER057c/UK114 family)
VHFSSKIVRLGVDVLPPMSQAVIHNGIVHLSGQVDGTADDVTGQTKNVLAKVDKYLHEAGTDKSKLLTSTIWLKDIGRDIGAMNEVRI